MSDLVKPLAALSTSADPAPDLLLSARRAVKQNPRIEGAFSLSRTEGWSADDLVRLVAALLSEDLNLELEQAEEVSRYLVDEYAQIGDAPLLIDPVTGRAVRKVTDEDTFQPPMVPRSDGTMVTPPRRLKPEIEAALILRQYEDARDQEILADMVSRAKRMGLTTVPGSRHLLPVTRAGRAHFVDILRDSLPTLIPGGSGGVLGRVLSALPVIAAPPTEEHLVGGAELQLLAHVRIPVQDPRTFNLRYDRLAAVQRSILAEWVFQLLRTSWTLTHSEGLPTRWDFTELLAAGLPQDMVWAAPPGIAAHFHGTLAVSGERLSGGWLKGLLGLRGQAGALLIDPDGYRCEAREVHDRWEIAARCSLRLWVDPLAIQPVEVTGYTEQIQFEVVTPIGQS